MHKVWLSSSFLVMFSVVLCLNKTLCRADCIKNTPRYVFVTWGSIQ